VNQLQKFLEVAKAEVGYIEGPKDNQTKYQRANQPWCGAFVNWVAKQAGVKIPNCVYTPSGATAFMDKKAWTIAEQADPKPGDIVFFDFVVDELDRIGHVGIVIKNNGKGIITTIEGNTSSNKKGSQANGGEVCLKIRAYKKKNSGKLKPSLPVFVVGFGRPKFNQLQLLEGK
jgi:hypothetical protein